jgi:hypothetical protein
VTKAADPHAAEQVDMVAVDLAGGQDAASDRGSPLSLERPTSAP